MMQTAQMLLSELVDKVSKCSKNRLEMQMVGAVSYTHLTLPTNPRV